MYVEFSVPLDTLQVISQLLLAVFTDEIGQSLINMRHSDTEWTMILMCLWQSSTYTMIIDVMYCRKCPLYCSSAIIVISVQPVSANVSLIHQDRSIKSSSLISGHQRLHREYANLVIRRRFLLRMTRLALPFLDKMTDGCLHLKSDMWVGR